MFYAALALGPISIVSPLTAVAGAVLPVIVDVALGQSLGAFTILAIVIIIVAAGLVSVVPSKSVPLPSLKALALSMGGGAGFAGIFVFLDQTPVDSGIAPLVVMRIVGVAMLGAAVIYLNKRDRSLQKPKDRFPKILIGMIAVSAVLDVSANLFFLIGTREGVLAIVAVVTSLYPIGTVALARVVLKEKLANLQWMGVGLAIFGCVLLAI
jgi:drug/metabolite transporter (DMT)-like permease